MEEAGAEIISARIVGGWEIFVHGDTPLRPGVPHPRFFRLLHVGEVRLRGRPEPIENGETILEVRAVPLNEAEELFNRSGRSELAELYRLAGSLFGDQPFGRRMSRLEILRCAQNNSSK